MFRCLCGCGVETGVWSRNDYGKGRIKGEHKKYISGHKLPPSFKGVKRTIIDRKNDVFFTHDFIL